jgi:hypothetical protein
MDDVQHPPIIFHFFFSNYTKDPSQNCIIELGKAFVITEKREKQNHPPYRLNHQLWTINLPPPISLEPSYTQQKCVIHPQNYFSNAHIYLNNAHLFVVIFLSLVNTF